MERKELKSLTEALVGAKPFRLSEIMRYMKVKTLM